MSEFFIGLMSGTSADSIDAALIDFSKNEIRSLGTYSHPIPEEIKNSIYESVNSENLETKNLTQLDIKLGEIFSEAVNEILIQEGISSKSIKAIGSHGQTIKHSPDSSEPFSLQIGNAQILANSTGIKTVSNFRSDDILAGGQGAPITPVFNENVFISERKTVIINLGGIANITILGPKISTLGYDTGPANCLLDSWARKNRIGSYDEGGNWALSGTINKNLLSLMLENNYFKKPYPKSTGPDFFNLEWVESIVKTSQETPSSENLQATLLELTVQSLNIQLIGLGIQEDDDVFFCGGGIHNRFLMKRIKEVTGLGSRTTSEIGVDPDYLEAISFAWFAYQRIQERKFDLSKITGSKAEVFLGVITEPVR